MISCPKRVRRFVAHLTHRNPGDRYACSEGRARQSRTVRKISPDLVVDSCRRRFNLSSATTIILRIPLFGSSVLMEVRTTVAVVGGGATGLAIGLEFVQAGIDFILIEKIEPGMGTTCHSAGVLHSGA